MRLLLVGAFPYPHDQGSQVYFQEQAIALRAAGAEVSLLTYATKGKHAEHRRALDGFEQWTSPGWTAPTSRHSGPSWSKPLGDLGLAMTLRDAVASRKSPDAYDAILTHNAEATVVALLALSGSRPAIVYCLHTLLGHELSSYLKSVRNMDFSSPPSPVGQTGLVRRGLDRFGSGIDRWIGQRVDGWLSLTQSSERVMRQFSSCPGLLVAPAIPDPQSGKASTDPSEIAAKLGLEPGGFFVYSGNLDAYQELDLLAAAAARLADGRSQPFPLVIATHDDRIDGCSHSMPGIEFRRLDSVASMQALLAAARASLVMRRTPGGFPIKLVNSLAVGTPPIAFHDREWGLEDGRNSVICSPDRPVATLVDAIERLRRNDALANRLASGARALYAERHRPEQAATRTLALLERVVAIRRR